MTFPLMFRPTFPFLGGDVSKRTHFGNSETFWRFVQLSFDYDWIRSCKHKSISSSALISCFFLHKGPTFETNVEACQMLNMEFEEAFTECGEDCEEEEDLFLDHQDSVINEDNKGDLVKNFDKENSLESRV